MFEVCLINSTYQNLKNKVTSACSQVWEPPSWLDWSLKEKEYGNNFQGSVGLPVFSFFLLRTSAPISMSRKRGAGTVCHKVMRGWLGGGRNGIPSILLSSHNPAGLGPAPDKACTPETPVWNSRVNSGSFSQLYFSILVVWLGLGDWGWGPSSHASSGFWPV